MFWDKKSRNKQTRPPVKIGNFDYINENEKLIQKAEKISKIGFIGGGLKKFEKAGRAQLITLLQLGLYPDSKVLDIGCGCLRGGYWLIHFLRPRCYFGIEPNSKVLNAGIRELFDEEVIKMKEPQFDYNDEFNLSIFDVKYDFMIARSIWTHCAKWQIKKMLDEFCINSHQNSFFVTSILLPSKKENRLDYNGTVWIGKSHTNNKKGTVGHSIDWIAEECESRSLSLRQPTSFEHGKQHWLLISHKNKGI